MVRLGPMPGPTRWLLAALLLAACGDDADAPAPDASADGGPGAVARDGGAGQDGGGGRDATPGGDRDGGPLDLGAGPLDASAGDAGPAPDAGPDPTSCDDVHASALVCDGFEDGLDRWESGWGGAESMIGLEERRAYRGRGALRVRAPVDTATAFARADLLGGIGAGELYLRAYYLVPSGPPLTTVYLLSAGEAVSPYGGLSVGFRGASTATAALSTASHAWDATTPVPDIRDRWVCLEARLELSDTAGALELWIDGEAVLAVADVDTLPVGGYSRLAFGVTGVEAGQPPIEVLVDEIVVSTERVGCDPP